MTAAVQGRRDGGRVGETEATYAACQRGLQTVLQRLKAWASVVRRRPAILLVPLLFFAVVAALGVWGVVHAAGVEASSQHAATLAFGETMARSMRNAMSHLYMPANAVASMVLANVRKWDAIVQGFETFATAVVDTARADPASTFLALWPQGIQTLARPPSNSLGLNLLDVSQPVVRDTYLGYMTADGVALNGPFLFGDPNQRGGVLYGSAVVPIYVSNVSETETFGIPGYNGALVCPACYNTTSRTKFWGFVSSSVPLNKIFDDAQQELQLRGYRYALKNPYPTVFPSFQLYGVSTIFSSDLPPKDGVTVPVGFDSTGYQWLLVLSPEGGYEPPWRDPLIAVVVIMTLALAVLLHLVMLSRYKHRLLLEALLPPKVIDRMHSGLDSFLNLGQYTTTGSPADIILSLTEELLEGKQPSLRDVVMIRTAIKQSADIYSPMDVTDNIKAAFDEDVAQSLLQQLQLGGKRMRLSGSVIPPLSRTEDDPRFADVRDGLVALLEGDTAPTLAPTRSIEGTPPVSGMSGDSPCSQNGDVDTRLTSALSGLGSASARTSVLARLASGNTSPSGNKVAAAIRGRASLRSVFAGIVNDAPGISSGIGARATSRNGSTIVSGAGLHNPQQFIITHAPMDEVEAVLASSWEWQCDVFKLHDVTGGRALSALGFFIMHHTGLVKQFNISGAKLARFLRAAEDLYQANPYHNSTHAAGVLHAMHVMLERGGLVPGYADPLTRLACLMAAAVHDVDHNGRTNDFLTNTMDDLALCYNDRSPQENHHLAIAFSLLKNPDMNFLSSLSSNNRTELRRLVIELVLATDMKAHFQLVSHFSTLHRLGGAGEGRGSLDRRASMKRADSIAARKVPTVQDPPTNVLEADASPDGRSRIAVPPTAERYPSGGGDCRKRASGAGQQQEAKLRVCTDDTERLLSLQVALKCADLAHMGAELAVYLRWVAVLEEEFFRQGDAERDAGLPISPLFDRQKPGVSKSQPGFYEFVVVPLYSSFTKAFPGVEPLHAAVMSNYHYVVAEKAKQDAVNIPDSQKASTP